MFRAVLATILVVFAPFAAAAATIVDTAGPGYTDERQRLDLGTGRYRVVMNFDQPVTDAYVFILNNLSYNFYDPADPTEYLGGNDVEYYSEEYRDVVPSTLTFRFSVDRPYDVCGPWECESGVYSVSAIEYGFHAQSSTAYSIDVQYLGAVPEPSTWALMILAFLGLGVAMRKHGARRNVSSLYARHGFASL